MCVWGGGGQRERGRGGGGGGESKKGAGGLWGGERFFPNGPPTKTALPQGGEIAGRSLPVPTPPNTHRGGFYLLESSSPVLYLFSPCYGGGGGIFVFELKCC